NARTIVPVTTDSANRSGSKIAPNYIHDKLEYVAGDFLDFGGEEKKKERFEVYRKQMKEWAESANAPQKIKAIYSYISKGNIISDLVNENILPVDENEQVLDKWPNDQKDEKPKIYKVVTDSPLSASVRFDVLHKSSEEPVVWEDDDLFDNFKTFLSHTDEDRKSTRLN